MTNAEDKQRENPNGLLSDSDFVSLMEAEHASNNELVDELRKQRIWNNVKPNFSEDTNKEPESAPSIKRYYPITAMLLIAIISLPLVFLDDKTELNRIKGDDDFDRLSLYMYTLDSKGALVNGHPQHRVGATLVFKVHGTAQGVAALIISRNGKLTTNDITFPLDQNSGEQLLSVKNNIYGYMIEPTDKILQFCVVSALNTEQLSTKMKDLEISWNRLPAKACTKTNVRDSIL